MKTCTKRFITNTIITLGILVVFILPACNEDDEPKPKENEPGTVTDIDGNTYKTVLIGNQEWMAENLKTTKYRDGSNIEYPGNDTIMWQLNTSGAYAWYNNDQSNKNTYGALYNWYTVKNEKGLCPQGWRVFSSQDWSQLMSYLTTEFDLTNSSSDVNAIGNKLKSCRMLNSPLGGDCATSAHPRWNFHATAVGNDEFNFSALPGGSRSTNGKYGSIGLYGFWWTISELDEKNAFQVYINYDQHRTHGSNRDKLMGLSVRCIKE